ncbi:MAG: hypothetical protein AAF682_08035 [Planctomycetota bacterium]
MTPSFRSGLRLTSLILTFLFGLSVSAAASADLATASAHLKRAEANLNLVDGSIGHLTSPPKGSAAKLAKMRLDQADGDLKPAGDLLAKLADAPGVAEARERHKKGVALRDKLRGILEGKPAPKPEPKPQPKPQPKPTPKPSPRPEAAKTVKLGYPHADNFKGVLFNLRRVEGEASGLTELAGELAAVQDQLGVSYRTTASAVATLTETRRQMGFVEDGIAKIPANGEGVAEAKERIATAKASLDAAEGYFKPLNTKLTELVDPARYPAAAADTKRLSELSFAYANPELQFREQRARAAEAFAQSAAAKAECERIGAAYARLVQQETDLGTRVAAACNGFARAQQAFLAMAETQKASLPAEIRADLAEADRMADEAVQNQKPLWFTGGIPQRMGWVDDKLALYEALDAEAGAALRREVDAKKATLRQRADSLRELIIRENEMPLDRFAGPDRDAAIAVAKDAWGIQEEGFELLAVRIPSEAWSRETKWTYSNGTWYFSDRSTLQVRLLVADTKNPELAIDRPVNVRKDHQKNDTLIGVPMRSFDEELEPSEYLLRAKVR